MKNFKKFTAFVLALCMLFSLSISAFAAEKTPTGYLTWTLDDSGTLTISGNGRIAAFTSAEDQPWHEMRENITSVKFDPGAHMVVPDVAYWFKPEILRSALVCKSWRGCVQGLRKSEPVAAALQRREFLHLGHCIFGRRYVCTRNCDLR